MTADILLAGQVFAEELREVIWQVSFPDFLAEEKGTDFSVPLTTI